ncbi:MAG: glycosyltransferase [Magnetococcales bacterium]|nr:glycosyltransferase [Magnetococcales bacterium]
MSTEPLLVTVMMPARNCERYIARAVESVLHQTYANLELIIWDDGSQDGTLAKAKAYADNDARVTVFSNDTKQGIPKTRNNILNQAKGTLLCHVDADDYIELDALAIMVQAFRDNPAVALIYSDSQMVDAKEKFLKKQENAHFSQANLVYLGWFHLGMYKTAVAREVGGYNEQLITCSDGDLFMKIAVRYPCLRVPQCLYNYRSHDTNVGHGKIKCPDCTKQPVCQYYIVWTEAMRKRELVLAAKTGRAEEEKLDGMIRDIVKGNPYQLSFEEYKYIAQRLVRAAPCNFLIFGCGRDSGLWKGLNPRGRTVFLEHDQKWLDDAREKFAVEGYLVHYETRLKEWDTLLDQYTAGKNPFRFKLPESCQDVSWDMILVDAPPGYGWELPGRMESIHAAFLLAKERRGVDVFIHDCNRKIENIYTGFFFGRQNIVCAVSNSLYHCRL